MVSHPEHSQLLSVRGPSSLVSRASSSRHRRHGRSHTGGSSYTPQNDFPVFTHTGDVEIIVRRGGSENRYLLHRLILSQCSGFFEASTSQEWSKAAPDRRGGELALVDSKATGRDTSTAQSATGNKQRWRYELDSGADTDDIPMLVQKATDAPSLFGAGSGSMAALPPPSVRNKPPPASHSSFFRSVANLSLTTPSSSRYSESSSSNTVSTTSQADEDLLRDYNNLLLIFYNYPPSLSAVDIAAAYTQCKSLLALADLYDALPVVGPRVDHHLLQFRSRLWKQIAKYPTSYLRLGYLARSRVIFAEALVHVVGQWPLARRGLLTDSSSSPLPAAVIDLVEDKVDELDDRVARVDGRLFRLGLATSRGGGGGGGERVTPHNAYLDWLALSLFRQWLADNTGPLEPAAHPPAPKAGGAGAPQQQQQQPQQQQQQQQRRPSTRGSASNAATGHHGVSSSPATSAHSQQQQQQQGQAPPPPSSSMQTAAHAVRTGRAYRALGAGGAAYLGHDECKRFLKLSPESYSREGLRRFERRLDELKLMAREVAAPLMWSGLELEGGGTGAGAGREGAAMAASSLGYLSCTRVDERDFPWDD